MRIKLGTTLVCSLLAVSQLGHTQSTVLEEVVVSARKKAESLQDVPISINVISGEDIQNQGLGDMQAITAEIPAVNLNRAGASAFVNVRGVGSGENPGFEQSVGFVVDGIPIGRSRATRAGQYDLERVEILKGPQTTYFGANTIAGVFNVTTKAPSISDGVNGSVMASYEFEAEAKVVEGAVNIPMGDTFAVRLAGKLEDSEGFGTNPGLNEDWAAKDDKLFRVYAMWAPTENFEATFKYDHVEMETNSGLDLELIDCIPGGQAQGDCIDANGRPVETKLDNNRTTDLPDEFRKLDLEAAALTLNYTVGDFTLSSLTGWYNFENEFLLDLDGTTVPGLPGLPASSRFAVNQFDDADDPWSQEFRVSYSGNSALSWEAGVFYQEEDMQFSNMAQPAFVPIALQAGARQSQHSESWSVFGSLNYDFTERLSATLGVRYIETEKDIKQSPDLPQFGYEGSRPDASNFQPTGGITFEEDSSKDDDTLIAVDLSYALTDNVNIYGSFRQGFKAGGYSLSNPPRGQLVDYIQPFDPETVDAYEIGAKGVYWDGRVNLNAALFYMEYDDRQVSVLGDGAGLSQNVANAATSTSQGLEIELIAQATERLRFRGSLSVLDSEFDEFENAPCYTGQTEALGCSEAGTQDLSGHDTTFAPEFSGVLTATWEQPLGDYILTIEPGIYYTDEYWTISNFYPQAQQDSFTKINLRVAFAPESYQWEIAFIGRNLNDETTKVWCQGGPASPGNVFCTASDPATYAIQARYNF